MGQCCSSPQTGPDLNKLSPEAKTAHQQIENILDGSRVQDHSIKKLLLLGAGSSGKSTIFRHLSMVLTRSGDDNVQMEEMRQTIRKNCVIGMMKLLKQTIKLHEANRNQYESNMFNAMKGGYNGPNGPNGYNNNIAGGYDPNFGNKPFYVSVFSLQERQESYFLKFKESMADIIEDYSNKCFVYKNNKIGYRNDDYGFLWIPDPSLWNNNDPSCQSLNPHIIKTLIVNRMNNRYVHARNSNIVNNINQLTKENVKIPNNLNDMNSMNFDIIENPDTFIQISLNIVTDDMLLASLMVDCLHRKREYLRDEYFRQQSEFDNKNDSNNEDNNNNNNKSNSSSNIKNDSNDGDNGDGKRPEFLNFSLMPVEIFLEQMQFSETEQAVLFYHSMEHVVQCNNEHFDDNFDKFESEFVDHRQSAINGAMWIMPSDDKQNSMIESANELVNIGKSLSILWESHQIRETFMKRQRYKFSFPDNMSYFYQNLDSIFAWGYIPTQQDILRCRIRTTGVVKQVIEYDNNKYHIFDAGGQRNERKKWIHSFEGVTAVLFVAALNHYASVCFEDEEMNSMIESINLFYEILNSKWFKRTEMILFLNKDDLFQNCILDDIPLSFCFCGENGCVSKQYTAVDELTAQMKSKKGKKKSKTKQKNGSNNNSSNNNNNNNNNNGNNKNKNNNGNSNNNNVSNKYQFEKIGRGSTHSSDYGDSSRSQQQGSQVAGAGGASGVSGVSGVSSSATTGAGAMHMQRRQSKSSSLHIWHTSKDAIQTLSLHNSSQHSQASQASQPSQASQHSQQSSQKNDKSDNSDKKEKEKEKQMSSKENSVGIAIGLGGSQLSLHKSDSENELMTSENENENENEAVYDNNNRKDKNKYNNDNNKKNNNGNENDGNNFMVKPKNYQDLVNAQANMYRDNRGNLVPHGGLNEYHIFDEETSSVAHIGSNANMNEMDYGNEHGINIGDATSESFEFMKECEIYPSPDLRYGNKLYYCNGSFSDLTDPEWFEFVYANYLHFIIKEYKSKNQYPRLKNIYTHVTTATDPQKIIKLFWDVQNIVVKRNLKKGGLLF